jgi:gluconokinase
MLTLDTPVPVNGKPSSGNALPSTGLNNLGRNPMPVSASAAPVAVPSTTPAMAGGQQGPKHHHIWLVTGPAGCGKSTVAQHLSSTLNLPYIEGDEFHPPANIEKMSNGIPLTDADRWDWLTLLREESLRQLALGAEGVVLTCSALKRKYRDVIRVAPYYSHDVILHFIYLHAPEEVLLARVGARQGHYMGANMVQSQFAILEPPAPEEMDVISVDVSKSMVDVQKEALEKVLQKIDTAA